jgi:hypothetical protein
VGIGQAATQRTSLQIADVRDQPALIVPLLGAERIVGALVVTSSSCRFRGWADQAGQ